MIGWTAATLLAAILSTSPLPPPPAGHRSPVGISPDAASASPGGARVAGAPASPTTRRPPVIHVGNKKTYKLTAPSKPALA